MKKQLAKNAQEVTERLTECTLFKEMTAEDIRSCFDCSGAELVSLDKGEFLFTQTDKPKKMFLLVDGSVLLGRDSSTGRREIISTMTELGDIIGAEDLFLSPETYDSYAEAIKKSTLILMPKDFLLHTCVNVCSYHAKLISNMLYVFALKAKRQDERLEIMNGASLRQKISKMLMIWTKDNTTGPLKMNRERMAEYLNVARPSLSRELTKMKDEGLIDLQGKEIIILNEEALK